MAQQGLGIPNSGIFGGLMRFDEEYKSRFMLSPGQVVGFLVLIVVFIVLLYSFG